MRREFDGEGLLLASFQAKLFEQSLTHTNSSSPVFLRRAMKSDLLRRLDEGNSATMSLDVDEGFAELQKEYGPSDYGQLRFAPSELYWIGWMYRYIAYTRFVSSRRLYSLIKPAYLRGVYFAFHTQGEEWVIARLLDDLGLTEGDLDANEIVKKGLRERFQNDENLVVQ